MTDLVEVKVPDIGEFDAVDVIEVLVSPGDEIEVEQSLITLESDKASMEVPSSHAGVVKEVKISVGDKVSEGDVVCTVEASASAGGGGDAPAAGGGEAEKPAEPAKPAASEPAKPAPAAAAPQGDAPADADCDVLVLGAGPGGYTAAFRAADLGLKTVLVERYPNLGGVCLNVGCIPSKALLHAAKVIDEAEQFADHGITFGKPKLDIRKLADWKTSVVKKLTGGLAGLAKQRKVEVVTGKASFKDAYHLEVDGPDGKRTVSFRHCIIAAGSRPVVPPPMAIDDPRVMDSTGALELEEVPERLLVVGGGIIGLEMACVYDALGSKVTVVELADRLMTGADADLVKALRKRIDKRYEAIYLNTMVKELKANKKSITVTFEGKDAPESDRFDRVLLSVGRRPNTDLIGLEATGLKPNDHGCIDVDEYMRTGVPHIHAIGDIVGQPMLAHKAVHEGKIAAEVIAGEKSAWDARVIPSVAYTDPEVAWVGVTEEQAKAEGIKYEKGAFPWAANGRSLSLNYQDGITKLLFDEESGQIIGAGIVGPNAGDLIGEVGLAIEMGADAADIGLTVHPHPTLSETVAMAAEAAEGTLTDLYIPKKKK